MPLSCVLELQEVPPNILSVSAIRKGSSNRFILRHLTKPQDFVVHWLSGEIANRESGLRCEASNADTIYWEYKTLEDDLWNRTLPTTIRVFTPDPPNGGELISLTIDDGDTVDLPELNKLNGFYRCNAENTEKGYKIQAAPVRIVYPCKLDNYTDFVTWC